MATKAKTAFIVSITAFLMSIASYVVQYFLLQYVMEYDDLDALSYMLTPLVLLAFTFLAFAVIAFFAALILLFLPQVPVQTSAQVEQKRRTNPFKIALLILPAV